MGLQVPVLGEFFVANIAFKWLLIGVGSDVNLEASTSLILFPTKLANMGFFTRMDQNVGGQVALGDKRLVAAFIGTVEWSLTCMDAHVCLKITCLFELLHAC